MFKSKRSAFPALILPAVLAGGTWLFLCLSLEIPMYACGILALIALWADESKINFRPFSWLHENDMKGGEL